VTDYFEMDTLGELFNRPTPTGEPPTKTSASKTTHPTQPEPTPIWTYPTRMCRICREDVVPTVTMYPPGLPPAFQRPLVEYKNDDEYGRLIRPCKCRGGMRYIHEYCLLRSRTEGVRAGSLWKCHECGHKFNFQRLTLQRYLGSKVSSGVLAALIMVIVMFLLGFIADPLINLYVDPYDTLVGKEDYWREIDINESSDSISGWSLHFLKGLVSMGLVGFIKTALLNPFQWWNLRTTGWSSGRASGTSNTGRDRAVNISWIAVAVGISSAFYFFYQWTQTIVGKTLQRIGNNIVDTQLPGDDDDIKPPPDFKFQPCEPTSTTQERGAKTGESSIPGNTSTEYNPSIDKPKDANIPAGSSANPNRGEGNGVSRGKTLNKTTSEAAGEDRTEPVLLVEQPATSEVAFSSALDNARDQGWSFVDIPQ
jgi:RING-variant domain